MRTSAADACSKVGSQVRTGARSGWAQLVLGGRCGRREQVGLERGGKRKKNLSATIVVACATEEMQA